MGHADRGRVVFLKYWHSLQWQRHFLPNTLDLDGRDCRARRITLPE